MADSSQRFDWTLDPEAFGRFLARLDHDLGKAAIRYERLRIRLVRLFEWRGCAFPEDLADQTLDRVVHMVQQGLDIEGKDLMRYSAGVARNIAQEHWRDQKRRRVDRGDAQRPPFVPGRHSTTDLRLAQLERCLEQLGAEERRIILGYYPSDKAERIRGRRQLAEELGLQSNALRIRAYRIRAKLLDLMQSSSTQSSGPATPRGREH